jgi:hypothetical protein
MLHYYDNQDAGGLHEKSARSPLRNNLLQVYGPVRD